MKRRTWLRLNVGPCSAHAYDMDRMMEEEKKNKVMEANTHHELEMMRQARKAEGPLFKDIDHISGSEWDEKRMDVIGQNGNVTEYLDNSYQTKLTSVYGLCMFKDADNSKTFIFVTDEESLAIYQYEIQTYAPISAKLVRTIPTQSVSEGCVVDDDLKILYFSQEDDKSGIFKTTLRHLCFALFQNTGRSRLGMLPQSR